MLKLFTKKPKTTKETAPQLTHWDRAAFALPGTKLGQLSYQTYDDMLKDSMVQTVVTLKRLAILAAEFEIVPASGSDRAKRNADFVIENFDRLEGSPLEIVSTTMSASLAIRSSKLSVQETPAVASGCRARFSLARRSQMEMSWRAEGESGAVRRRAIAEPTMPKP